MMIERLMPSVLLVFAAFILTGDASRAQAPGSEPGAPPLPPARSIPAINAEDRFPRGCVDCHIYQPDMNLDVRLSTLLRQWSEKVEPALLAKAQAAAPQGLVLKGRHPDAPGALKNIPASCLTCHSKASKTAPPFSRMLHNTHLTGGGNNHFMTLFQGECTHCHKLDAATGGWLLPSGAER
jgi:hypothetical protein